MLVIPPWKLFKKSPKIPHVAPIILKRDLANEYGTIIQYIVREARNGKSWWVYAIFPSSGHLMHSDYVSSMKASTTLRTSSKKIADGWIKSVESGDVMVGD